MFRGNAGFIFALVGMRCVSSSCIASSCTECGCNGGGLWLLVPVLGPVWLVISMGFRGGTEGHNQYGADPRMANVDYLTVDTP